MLNDSPFAATEREDGAIAGPLREPRNLEQAIKGSIHDDARTEVWMDHEDGHRVAAGTASVGKPDPASVLRLRLQQIPTPSELRILSDPAGGDDIASMLMMLRFMKASHPAWQ